MTKENILNIRIDYDDLLMLEKLCADTVRTKSDMIRYLIRKEWEARQDDPDPVRRSNNFLQET